LVRFGIFLHGIIAGSKIEEKCNEKNGNEELKFGMGHFKIIKLKMNLELRMAGKYFIKPN
jgi:hypothetical protein